jgi:hypothetical protein
VGGPQISGEDEGIARRTAILNQDRFVGWKLEMESAALCEIARVCHSRFQQDATTRSALQELFARAGASEEFAKGQKCVAVMERFRRRAQRRAQRRSKKCEGLEMTCPITMARPVEPVLLFDGHVYERRAIDAWLSKHQTSPLTRESVARPYLPWVRVATAYERFGKS